MLVLPDNDVTGIVAVLRWILEADEWREYSQAIGLRFTSFGSLSLSRDATDRQVWDKCQSLGVVLITANRAGGIGSLDEVIQECGRQTSLPVITLSDPQRIQTDGEYASRAAMQLLDYVERIDSLLGAGRLFIP